jgi:hypothetical protein
MQLTPRTLRQMAARCKTVRIYVDPTDLSYVEVEQVKINGSRSITFVAISNLDRLSHFVDTLWNAHVFQVEFDLKPDPWAGMKITV